MPVPASINDLSTTAGSNSPGGSETPSEGDNYLRTLSSFIALLRDKLNGTSDTGTVKNATFSGTMAGAASWSGLQTFAGGIAVPGASSFTQPTITTPTINGAVTFGEGWELDTSGRLKNTSAEMPAFHAYRTGSTDQTSGTVAIFGSELFDQASSFNSATGVFTAPVAGIYLFNVRLRLGNGDGSTSNDTLLLTGSTAGTLCSVPVLVAPSEADVFTLSCVAKLAAAETVSVGLLSGAAFSSSGLYVENGFSARNNSFSGALLY